MAFFMHRHISPKQAILRGVYEDNLRILGKGGRPKNRRMPFFLKASAVFFALLVVLVLGNAGYLGSDPVIKSSTQGLGFPGEIFSIMGDKDVDLKKAFGLGVKTIVIDPGHGGADPGTSGKLGLLEKDITLDIAKRLRDRLLATKQYEVLLTREKDETLPLTARTDFANRRKADIFVSVHVNYLPKRPVNIIETYYFGPSTDDETLSLAAAENEGHKYGIGEFKDMVEKIGSTLKLQESRKLASDIQDSLYLNISSRSKGVLNFGIKRAPFVVLMTAGMPSVLAEVACISNKSEEQKLGTEAYRDDIARYLETGIQNYLKEGDAIYEARRSGQ